MIFLNILSKLIKSIIHSKYSNKILNLIKKWYDFNITIKNTIK